jgi:hypothetical protein
VGVFLESGAAGPVAANAGAGAGVDVDVDAGAGAGADVGADAGASLVALVLQARDGSSHLTCADAGWEGGLVGLVGEGDR